MALLELVPQSDKTTEDSLLDSHDVALMLKVDLSWVKNHTSRTEPRLPHFKLGKGRNAIVRYRRHEIRQFIEEHFVKPARRAA